MKAISLPRGWYWVGDPCYAIKDNQWMPWLEAADYESNPEILSAKVSGQLAVGVGTAYGDGVYEDEDGREYPVDAGLIGVVPEKVALKNVKGSHLILFDKPFEVSREDKRFINLGHIRIDTDPDEDNNWYS